MSRSSCQALYYHHYPEPCCTVTCVHLQMFVTIWTSNCVFSQNIRSASLRCINAISRFPVHEVKGFNPPLPNSNCVFFVFFFFINNPICAWVYCCWKHCSPEFYHPPRDIFRCCHFGPERCELWLSRWTTGRDWLDERQSRPEQSGTLLQSHKGLQSPCSVQSTPSCLPLGSC